MVLPGLRFGYVDLDPKHLYPFASAYGNMIANPLILEFLFGCSAAWLYAKTRDRLTPTLAFWLLAAGVTAFCLSVIMVETQFSLVWRGLPTFLLLFGMMAAEQTGLLHIPRWSVQLGAISYGLYLIHPIIIESIKRLTIALAPSDILYQLIKFAVTLIISLWLATVVHRYLELPSIAIGRRLSSSPGRM